MNLELSPLFVHIPLFIVNINFDFQVYLFSNSTNKTKCQFLQDDHENAKGIAIPLVFSESSPAKKHKQQI